MHFYISVHAQYVLQRHGCICSCTWSHAAGQYYPSPQYREYMYPPRISPTAQNISPDRKTADQTLILVLTTLQLQSTSTEYPLIKFILSWRCRRYLGASQKISEVGLAEGWSFLSRWTPRMALPKPSTLQRFLCIPTHLRIAFAQAIP